MMRQNSIPTIPNPFNKDKLNQYEVNNDDRVKELCDSASKGIFKIEPKKELLYRILNMTKQLIDDAKLIDATNETTIETRLIQIIPPPKNIMCMGSNESLAKIIVGLFDIVKLLHLHLKSQETVAMGTRHATTNTKYKLIDDIINSNKNVDKQVIQNAQKLRN